MTPRAISNPGNRRLPLNVAALWLALAIALLSSLMPAGLPRTTLLGSAFNPATTAVALQPSRARPRILAETARHDDTPGGEMRALPLQTTQQRVRIERVATVVAIPEIPSPAVPQRQSVDLSGSPRGPPLA